MAGQKHRIPRLISNPFVFLRQTHLTKGASALGKRRKLNEHPNEIVHVFTTFHKINILFVFCDNEYR